MDAARFSRTMDIFSAVNFAKRSVEDIQTKGIVKSQGKHDKDIFVMPLPTIMKMPVIR